MGTERVNDQGFDVERLGRVVEAIRRDIEAERCDGVALMVAHGGSVSVTSDQGITTFCLAFQDNPQVDGDLY